MTIKLSVGDEIWAHATGKRVRTLAGKLDGSSLVVDGWKEGRTTRTLGALSRRAGRRSP